MSKAVQITKKLNAKQIITLGVILVMIANILLFAFGIITPLQFWIIIILGAIFAFFLLPKLK